MVYKSLHQKRVACGCQREIILENKNGKRNFLFPSNSQKKWRSILIFKNAIWIGSSTFHYEILFFFLLKICFDNGNAVQTSIHIKSLCNKT